MTPSQIELVQISFDRVRPIADTAARLFYGMLFEIAPEVRPLFDRDMKEQGRKLITTLALVTGGLKNLEAILPAARSLAAKHVSYGVRAEHYRPVGDALLWTLEQGLGSDFTPEVRDAWLAAYTTLSSAMIEEAYGHKMAA